MRKRKLTNPRPALVILILLGAVWNSFSTPWPLGTLTTNSASDANVPAGYSSVGYTVTCPGVSNTIPGFLAIRAAIGTPRGLIMTFTGGSGTGYWSAQGGDVALFAEELRTLGFTIVQVKWNNNWLESSVGNDAGQARLGCRPATVIKYVHDTYYAPLGIPKQKFRAGFVLTGNSGGASQVSYALSHYGLEDILDVVIPTGGPPHSALQKSCMNYPAEQGYWFELGTRQFIDRGFGFFDKNGPAAQQEASFIPRWLEASVSTGGNDYFHPNTRIHFIQGSQDGGMQTIGGDYYNRLRTNASPNNVIWEIAPNTPHAVFSTAEGRAAIKAAILGVELLRPKFSSNQFQFTVSGSTNLGHIVQASTNLTNWISRQTNRGPFLFSETNSPNAATRFYRAFSTP